MVKKNTHTHNKTVQLDEYTAQEKSQERCLKWTESLIALPVSHIFLLTFKYYFADENLHPNIKK